MTKTRREKIHDSIRDEIKSTARQLMSEKGTAGLSMRAIARQMGMTAPALYYYYDSLNDLITALIADAFTRLAGALADRAADPALTTAAARITAVAAVYRQWALDHPIDFQLIYGNPIPDYVQPTDLTYPAARRSFLVTATIFTQAISSGELVPPASYHQLPPAIESSLQQLAQVEGHQLPLPALYLAAAAWARIHGLVMLELFGLIQPVIADVAALFQYETKIFLQQIGLSELGQEKIE